MTDELENKIIDKAALIAALEGKNKQLVDLKQQIKQPIAIIGAACRFPGGANSLDEYWDLLVNGKDAISEVPSDRWDLNEYYDPDPDIPNKMYCKWGGFLTNIKVQDFDAKFFDIVSLEAQTMDPQQRLALEVTWEALESAYIVAGDLNGTNTGVFFGVSTNDYIQIAEKGAGITAYTNSGLAHSVLAGRISYELGLQGPSFVLDTACSSSLVAIHQACRSLRAGESSLAIVGGVNLMLTPVATIGFCKGGFLAPDGRCKTFDDTANGYVRGEGCGVIILKPLSDAKKDGDNILAVIRGSAVNQDGASSGLTVPNGPAQELVISQALIDANVNPSEIDYIEAHGTGTALGDPIEVNAIEHVLKEGRDKKQELIMASVKTNIGHLEAAAGMASIIKVILAMQHEKIPKHLHFKKLNRNIIIDENIRITIPAEHTEWKRGERKRIAGISGFAFQGTNAHVIIEEAPLVKQVEAAQFPNEINRPSHILTIAAKNIEALQDLAKYYVNLLNQNNTQKNYFAHLSFNANNFRSQFNQRLAIISNDASDAKTKLQTWLDIGESNGVISGQDISNNNPKLALLFTGQGSQYAGMGKDLYDTSPIFKEYLDICSNILSKNNYLDKPLLSILWGDDSNLLDETKYTQPALFALEYALYQLWLSWGITPSAVIGHSVGEYVAACLAGVFSLEDGLKLISKRAALMQSLPQNGAMAAIAVSEAIMLDILKAYDAEVNIAAINGPESVVISGNTAAVKKIVLEFIDKNIKTKELQVSHAFHSHLLEPMLLAFKAALSDVKFTKPAITLISNLTGDVISGDEIVAPEYWLKHTRNAVRFSDGIKALINLGVSNFIEIGPQPVLLGMAQESIEDLPTKLFLPSLRKDKASWTQLLESLGTLYVFGANINWKNFDKDYNRQKVLLPTYPFQRQRYWIDAEVGNLSDQSIMLGFNSGHILLGRIIDTPIMDDFIIFEAYYNALQQFINDHRVYDLAIVPGAGHIARLLCAAFDLFACDNVNVTEIDLQQPIVISEDEIVRSQLIIKPEAENKYNFEIYSTPMIVGELSSNIKWKKNVEGSFIINNKFDYTLDAVSIQNIKDRCKNELNINMFNEYYANSNFKYGLSFKWLEQIFVGDNECICFMRNASSKDDMKNLILHPGQIDCAFQAIASLGIANGLLHVDNKPAILAGIGEFKFYASPKGKLVCHIVYNLKNNVEDVVADVAIYDEYGNYVALAREVRAAKVSQEQITRALHDKETNNFSPYYQIQWQPEQLNQEIVPYLGESRHKWLIIASQSNLLTNITNILMQNNYDVIDANSYNIDFAKISDIEKLFSIIIGSGVDKLAGIAYLTPEYVNENNAINNQSIIEAQNKSYGVVLNIIKTLITNEDKLSLGKLALITTNAVATSRDEITNPFQATIWGIGKVIGLEISSISCKIIDISIHDAVNIAKELISDDIELQVALRSNARLVPRLARNTKLYTDTNGKLNILPDSTYLITGGLGSLGLMFAKHLSDNGAKHIILVGRHYPGQEAVSKISMLRRAGVDVKVVNVDISDAIHIKNVIADIENGQFKLRGIIHAAGTLDDAPIINQTFEKYLNVINAKILGSWNLHNCTTDIQLDFFVLFSSIVSLLGNAGQANYAAANEFMDSLASYRKSKGLVALSINWGPWADIGMAANLTESNAKAVNTVINPIAIDMGLQAFDSIVNTNIDEIAVMNVNWKNFLSQRRLVNNQLYSNITKGMRQSRNKHDDAKSNEFIQKLNTAPKETRVELMADYLESEIRRALGTDSNVVIDRNANLISIGIDSLIAVEIKNNLAFFLKHHLKNKLPSNMMFAYPDINSLSAFLVSVALGLDVGDMALKSTNDAKINSWLTIPIKLPNAKFRLFCFLYMGGDIENYYPWAKNISEDIEICIVSPLSSHYDPLDSSKNSIYYMLDSMSEELKLYMQEKPFSIFGHSMGAAVGFEFARIIKNKFAISAKQLFLSSFYTPDRYISFNEEFNSSSGSMFTTGNLPAALESDQEWVNQYKERVKMDSLCFDTIKLDLQPYDKCIYAFVGQNDKYFDINSVQAWGKFTKSKFEIKLINGGHFDIFNENNRTIVLNDIENIMNHD